VPLDERPAMTTTRSHPPGLYVLFCTELWERFSFYALASTITLYMDEALRFSQDDIGRVYGGYLAAVYFMPLLGGYAADRWLGYYRGVVVGALLMFFGQLTLAAGSVPTFFVALALLATGAGFVKPNISNIVGGLYHDRPHLRDSAFNIFYMGINIGAFLAPIAVAFLRQRYGWHVAFGTAAIAMLLALATFVGFRQYFAAGEVRLDERPGSVPVDPADARARIVALLVIFAIVVAFWTAFYQNGFTLTLWARDRTATSWPPEVFYSSNAFFIVVFTPLLVATWTALRRRGLEPTTIGKMVIGMLLTVATFVVMALAGLAGGDEGRVSPVWLVSAYWFISMGEICLSPMGLSLVTKVAPPGRRGLMMGAWFVATSAGGYLSGFLGSYWYVMPASRFFLMIAGLALVAAVLLMLAWRRLDAVIRSAEAVAAPA
jgi:POT family proton-dependent oligopeptide transporter